LAMVARVKDKVVIMAAIARTTEVTVVDTTLPGRATRTKAASSPLLGLPGPPSTILGLEPSTCTLVRFLGGMGGGGSSNTAFHSNRHLSLRGKSSTLTSEKFIRWGFAEYAHDPCGHASHIVGGILD
jgi:hypothetical protein